MKYFVATLYLFALSANQVFGQTTDSAEVDEADVARNRVGATSEGPSDVIKTLDPTTCYHNLRACYWKYSSVSELTKEGGLDKLIKQCNVDFAGCDKDFLQSVYEIILRVGATAGRAARIAGSTAQNAVNKAMDIAASSVITAAGIAEGAVDAAGNIIHDATDIAGKIANDAINTAKNIADRFKPRFG